MLHAHVRPYIYIEVQSAMYEEDRQANQIDEDLLPKFGWQSRESVA
jgi:hypothetical protein